MVKQAACSPWHSAKKIDTSFVIKTPRQTCMDDRKYPVTGGIYGRHASRTRPHVAAYPRPSSKRKFVPWDFSKDERFTTRENETSRYPLRKHAKWKEKRERELLWWCLHLFIEDGSSRIYKSNRTDFLDFCILSFFFLDKD